jgi:hypothetical protein
VIPQPLQIISKREQMISLFGAQSPASWASRIGSSLFR